MKKILTILFIFISCLGFSQQKKIKFDADLQFADEEKYPGATVLIGKVKMIHAGAILTSKKAFYYKEDNFFKAIGDVVINQGDTIKQYSDYVDYDADTKKTISWGDVILKDPTMTLTTDTLYFNRASQLLFYKDHAVIKDETNVLKSKFGNYYLEQKKFVATTKVTITNPDNLIESNHLDYYTNSGHAFLYGPSTITNQKDNNKIYSERGFYNTKTDISHFVKNAKLYLDERTIEGDSLYYDKIRGFASATNNIKVIDTAENFMAKGNYAEYFQKKDSIFMIKKAVAISVVENDSTFIHGDTLLVTGKKDARKIRSYYNVKFFKLDLQGKCDSLFSDQSKGITKMYVDPILWSDKSQITGDSIKLLSNQETNKLDSLKILGNSFIIQKDSLSLNGYNQIKGQNLYGKFVDQKLKEIDVIKNAESIYYIYNDRNEFVGIRKSVCSRINAEMIENKIETMTGFNNAESNIYPEDEFPENARKLRGFVWRGEERILTKEDIFPAEELALDEKAKSESKKKAIKAEKPMEILKETLEYDKKNPKPKDTTVKPVKSEKVK